MCVRVCVCNWGPARCVLLPYFQLGETPVRTWRQPSIIWRGHLCLLCSPALFFMLVSSSVQAGCVRQIPPTLLTCYSSAHQEQLCLSPARPAPRSCSTSSFLNRPVGIVSWLLRSFLLRCVSLLPLLLPASPARPHVLGPACSHLDNTCKFCLVLLLLWIDFLLGFFWGGASLKKMHMESTPFSPSRLLYSQVNEVNADINDITLRGPVQFSSPLES